MSLSKGSIVLLTLKLQDIIYIYSLKVNITAKLRNVTNKGHAIVRECN